MNTEKAIDLLDNLIGMIEDNQENDYDTAFHMAIDALKAQAERTEERTETHACDLISRQTAIDALAKFVPYVIDDASTESYTNGLTDAYNLICQLPSVQPDGIPLEWIDKHLEWLDNCDNDFAQLAKVSIKAMVELWKKDRI